MNGLCLKYQTCVVLNLKRVYYWLVYDITPDLVKLSLNVFLHCYLLVGKKYIYSEFWGFIL